MQRQVGSNRQGAADDMAGRTIAMIRHSVPTAISAKIRQVAAGQNIGLEQDVISRRHPMRITRRNQRDGNGHKQGQTPKGRQRNTHQTDMLSGFPVSLNRSECPCALCRLWHGDAAKQADAANRTGDHGPARRHESQASGSGIRLCYSSFGPDFDPALQNGLAQNHHHDNADQDDRDRGNRRIDIVAQSHPHQPWQGDGFDRGDEQGHADFLP